MPKRSWTPSRAADDWATVVSHRPTAREGGWLHVPANVTFGYDLLGADPPEGGFGAASLFVDGLGAIDPLEFTSIGLLPAE